MSQAPAALANAALPIAVRFDPVAGLLSYLVPGLGQIVQGRTGKGLVFLIGLYSLFFYGMFLGQWSNVFLGDTARAPTPMNVPRGMMNLWNRKEFAGQFWMGIISWPALYHYWHDVPGQDRGPISTPREFVAKFQKPLTESELNSLQRDGDKRWDLAWVYTVVAGVLNILVIYDALAGPAFAVDSGIAKESAPQEGMGATHRLRKQIGHIVQIVEAPLTIAIHVAVLFVKDYWHLPLLIYVASFVYSATRFDEWPRIRHEAWLWVERMTMFLAGIGLVLYLFSALDVFGFLAIGALVVVGLVVLLASTRL